MRLPFLAAYSRNSASLTVRIPGMRRAAVATTGGRAGSLVY